MYYGRHSVSAHTNLPFFNGGMHIHTYVIAKFFHLSTLQTFTECLACFRCGAELGMVIAIGQQTIAGTLNTDWFGGQLGVLLCRTDA